MFFLKLERFVFLTGGNSNMKRFERFMGGFWLCYKSFQDWEELMAITFGDDSIDVLLLVQEFRQYHFWKYLGNHEMYWR